MRGYGLTEKDVNQAIRDHLQSRRQLFLQVANETQTLDNAEQVKSISVKEHVFQTTRRGDSRFRF